MPIGPAGTRATIPAPAPEAPGTPPFVIPAKLTIEPGNPKKYWRTVHSYAVLSNLVYEKDEAKLRRTLADLGFKDVTLYGWGSSSTQAMVLTRDNLAIVVFRGTQEKTDMFTDARSLNPTADHTLEAGDASIFAGAELHRGFKSARDEIWDPAPNSSADRRLKEARQESLLTVLRKHAADGKDIVLTGHSLGGALATMVAASASLQKTPGPNGKPIMAKQVVTFGSPRVGNDAFVDAYDKRLGERTIPVHHHTDLVRGLPKVGYDHQVAESRTVKLEPMDPLAPPSRGNSHRMEYYAEVLAARADEEAGKITAPPAEQPGWGPAPGWDPPSSGDR